jgi:hypothetical protein
MTMRAGAICVRPEVTLLAGGTAAPGEHYCRHHWVLRLYRRKDGDGCGPGPRPTCPAAAGWPGPRGTRSGNNSRRARPPRP